MPGRAAPAQQALLDRGARRAAQEEVARPEAAAGREHPMGFAEEALARVEVDDALDRHYVREGAVREGERAGVADAVGHVRVRVAALRDRDVLGGQVQALDSTGAEAPHEEPILTPHPAGDVEQHRRARQGDRSGDTLDQRLRRLDEDGTARLPQTEVEVIVVERAVALDAGFVARTRALARRPTPTGRSLPVLEEARPQDVLRTMPDRAH